MGMLLFGRRRAVPSVTSKAGTLLKFFHPVSRIMFGWVKRVLSGSASGKNSQNEVGLKRSAGADNNGSDSLFDDDLASKTTLQFASPWDVADKYLLNNPSPTPYTVHALVEAGAADLLDPVDLTTACQKIEEHGYQYPINPVLANALTEAELLKFVRWQAQVGVAKESYANEMKLRELMEMFRASQ